MAVVGNGSSAAASGYTPSGTGRSLPTATRALVSAVCLTDCVNTPANTRMPIPSAAAVTSVVASFDTEASRRIARYDAACSLVPYARSRGSARRSSRTASPANPAMNRIGNSSSRRSTLGAWPFSTGAVPRVTTS